MENSRFDEFNLFVRDLGSETGRDPTIEEIRARAPREVTASDVLAAHRKDIDRAKPADPFKGEAETMQLRIARELGRPARKATEAPTVMAGMPRVLEDAKPGPVHPSLMELLDLEREPEPPTIRGNATPEPSSFPGGRVPDSWRAGDEILAKGAGDSRASILDRPFAEIMDAVAERAPTMGARELAKTVAATAREEGL